MLPHDSPVKVAPKPHIVVFMVDDWGWNNVGFHASSQLNAKEIQTPAIDGLAASGIVLDRFYSAPIFSPSRCAFHSGRDTSHVNVINDLVGDFNLQDSIGGFQGMPLGMTAIPEKLRDTGYRTYQIGKWHLGMATPHHLPIGRGYDYSFGYLSAGECLC
jgi:arylsulfatase A-like enzyme